MVTSKTKTVGLIGDPVEHSVSPDMHNAAFQELGLDYVYIAFRVAQENLPEALEGIKSLGIVGVNVTIPYKATVMNNLDEIRDPARKIGAVNTIKKEGEKLIGFNTDGAGVLKALQNKTDKIEGKNALLLGAGGAARAIAFTLVEAGLNLTISNRTASKAKNLAEEILEKTEETIQQIPLKEKELAESIQNSDILINSTSVGMTPNENQTLVKAESMHSNLTVMDIVYNPLQTKLLKEAEKVGAKTINGLGMLANQGAASFEIWAGEEPSVKVMKEAARKAMEEK